MPRTLNAKSQLDPRCKMSDTFSLIFPNPPPHRHTPLSALLPSTHSLLPLLSTPPLLPFGGWVMTSCVSMHWEAVDFRNKKVGANYGRKKSRIGAEVPSQLLQYMNTWGGLVHVLSHQQVGDALPNPWRGARTGCCHPWGFGLVAPWVGGGERG